MIFKSYVAEQPADVEHLRKRLDKLELDMQTMERELRARIGYCELTLHVPLDHQTIAQFK